MINIELDFLKEYSKIKAVIRALLYPLIAIPMVIYLIILFLIFYVLCFVCLVYTLFTKKYLAVGARFTKGLSSYLLRSQMYLLGLNDSIPSFKLSPSGSDLVKIEIKEHEEFNRVIALIYTACGWMLIIPQLVWFGLCTFFVVLLSFFNFWHLLFKGNHLIEFQIFYTYYAKLTSRLFVYFVGLRQEYPTFDLSDVVVV
ncbi:MAG: DUF4389 domain-containing protein [Patescibacteria group bacterium]